MNQSSMSGLDESSLFNEYPEAKDDILAELLKVDSVEPQNELSWASQGEANTRMMINQMNQNQLVTALYSQASTSSGLNTHMLYQVNNFSSPQPGTSQARKVPITGRETPRTARDQGDKKRLADKAYRDKMKEKRRKMESQLEGLQNENKKLKRENESLTKDKYFAEQKLQRANNETTQYQSEMSRLRHQSNILRIGVDAFTQKMFACDNVDEQRKQLEDELSGLIEKTSWEDWMSEKLQLLDRIELLKYQNRILNVQVDALCEKKYKQVEDPGIIRSSMKFNAGRKLGE